MYLSEPVAQVRVSGVRASRLAEHSADRRTGEAVLNARNELGGTVQLTPCRALKRLWGTSAVSAALDVLECVPNTPPVAQNWPQIVI